MPFIQFHSDICCLDQRIDIIDSTVRVQLAQRRNRNDNDRGGRLSLELSFV